MKNVWRNLSVSKKLYAVVGLMAILIGTELVTLVFAMNTLSSVRAFVFGEGLWTKAQKTAIENLYQYAFTGDETFYRNFTANLQVPEGDHIARTELEKRKFNRDTVRSGF